MLNTSLIHLPTNGCFVSTPHVTNKEATVIIETKLTNQSGKEETVQVITTIYNIDGAIVGKKSLTQLLKVGDTVTVSQELNVSTPKLWSLEDPYLYKAGIKVSLNDKTTDEYSQPFGIRFFNMDTDKGFSLNGKPVKILGVCNHHDLGALGAAINTRALERQLEILKAMGCNGIRTSHNPPAPELLELADKMGFIVMLKP